MRVLLTRPLPVAGKTAARLRALGHEAVIVPLSAIEPTQFPAPTGEFSALVATSANALRSMAQENLALFLATPLHAVGKSTATAARTAGFITVLEGKDDSAALGDRMIRQMPARGKILYLAGVPRKPLLEEALTRAGFTLVVHLAYRNIHAETAPDSLVKAFAGEKIDVILHYSRESARTFVRLMQQTGLASQCKDTVHLCLSADTATGLDGLGSARIVTSVEPGEDAILALLDQGH